MNESTPSEPNLIRETVDLQPGGFRGTIRRVPRIVEYGDVLSHMLGRNLRSLYHNSGAFGFDPTICTHTVGWIGPPDPTIRPAATALTRQIAPPFVEKLTHHTLSAWRQIGGPAWLMPMSHWSYELKFGNHDWLGATLQNASIDIAKLARCNQGAAIEFLPTESVEFATVLEQVFQHLANSDFALAFPERPVLAMIHHHQQVWWTSSDAALIMSLSTLKTG